MTYVDPNRPPGRSSSVLDSRAAYGIEGQDMVVLFNISCWLNSGQRMNEEDRSRLGKRIQLILGRAWLLEESDHD